MSEDAITRDAIELIRQAAERMRELGEGIEPERRRQHEEVEAYKATLREEMHAAQERAEAAERRCLDLIDDLQRLAEGFAMVDQIAEYDPPDPKLAAFVDEARAIAKKWRIR